MILDVIYICSSLQVAGEMLCVLNHVAVFFFFNGKKKSWLAFIVRLILLVGVQMLMNCN